MARLFPDLGDERYEPFEEGEMHGYVHTMFRPSLPSMAWVVEAEPAAGSILKDSSETTVFRALAPGWWTLSRGVRSY